MQLKKGPSNGPFFFYNFLLISLLIQQTCQRAVNCFWELGKKNQFVLSLTKYKKKSLFFQYAILLSHRSFVDSIEDISDEFL